MTSKVVRRSAESTRMVRVDQVMGTAVSLDIRDSVADAVGIDAFFAWLHHVDDCFSTYKETSEISRIGRKELTIDDASDEVGTVLSLCDDIYTLSDGAFDIWRCRDDRRVDPSGLVKGWSIERGATMLLASGLTNFCINAGGDVLAHGEAITGLPWKIGIRHPLDSQAVATVVNARDLAIATSGLYERGDHIIDPRTGEVPHDLLSMTVIGPSLTLADAYATAAFVMGTDGLSWIAKQSGYDACAITSQHRIISTSGFESVVTRS